jgi:hypothetical protein
VTLIRALRRLPPLETTVLLVCIAVIVWLGALNSAAKEADPDLDSFSSYDSASGGYRAFYTLLSDEGLRVDRFERRPAFLDSSIDTLVYVEPFAFDPRQVEPTAADIAALEAWVRGGGRLLYIGNDLVAAKNGILHLPASALVAQKRAGPHRTHAPSSEIASAHVVRVDSSVDRRWKSARPGTHVLYADAKGPLAVRYAYGRGFVTALIDETIFQNAEIGKFDRARLAYALARPGEPNGTIAFDETPHGYAVPDRWWTIVPRAFAIALGFALAAILIAIAGAAVRLGPPLVPVERRDRSSADFIDALSTLLERGGATRKALLDASTSTSRAIARSFALRDDATVDEIAAKIDRTDLRAAYRTMTEIATNDEAGEKNLLRGVALAQTIRKEFALHGRSRN